MVKEKEKMIGGQSDIREIEVAGRLSARDKRK